MELVISEIEAKENKLLPVELKNFDELEKEIKAKMTEFKSMKFTEENLKLASEYRSNLNKFEKTIDNRRIAIHKGIEEITGYNKLNEQCEILTGYVKEASTSIDAQIKDFESIEKNTKLQEILMYWIEKSGEYAELVNADKLVKEQWLNKTYSLNKIQDEIDHIIAKIKMDFSVLDNEVPDIEIRKRLKDFYFNNINDLTNVLAKTMAEKTRIKESNQKLDKVEEVTKSEANATNSSQNLTENKENITNSEVKQVDFRVWGTKEEILSVRNFMVQNNIKFGSVK